jgi:hypothetical protein
MVFRKLFRRHSSANQLTTYSRRLDELASAFFDAAVLAVNGLRDRRGYKTLTRGKNQWNAVVELVWFFTAIAVRDAFQRGRAARNRFQDDFTPVLVDHLLGRMFEPEQVEHVRSQQTGLFLDWMNESELDYGARTSLMDLSFVFSRRFRKASGLNASREPEVARVGIEVYKAVIPATGKAISALVDVLETTPEEPAEKEADQVDSTGINPAAVFEKAFRRTLEDFAAEARSDVPRPPNPFVPEPSEDDELADEERDKRYPYELPYGMLQAAMNDEPPDLPYIAMLIRAFRSEGYPASEMYNVALARQRWRDAALGPRSRRPVSPLPELEDLERAYPPRK